MSVTIARVAPGSPAHRAGVRAGESLVAINGNPVADVLDYRFYMIDRRLRLSLERDGGARCVEVVKEEYEELGLEFDSYLMDRQHHCKNKCVFCFIDQLPTGLRDTLYFKDDDSRMSFLFGSYVTLTNVTEEEIRRVIRMHISPVNISVHTTNPALRIKMMANPNAGESLRYLPMLADAGIRLNTQLVLCPGINDGPELRRSLEDLSRLGENLESIALVPVGLTKHRAGLYPLSVTTREQARETLAIAEEFGERMRRERGSRLAFASDELFLLAELPLPGADYYEGFPQLDNGVGLVALLRAEFAAALENRRGSARRREVSLATGEAAAPILQALWESAREKYPNVVCHIYGVPNRLFGPTVNVAGLVCGRDILHHLAGRPLGEELLIPAVMLRHEKDKFLDDTTPAELEAALGVPLRVVENDGALLLSAIAGRERVAFLRRR